MIEGMPAALPGWSSQSQTRWQIFSRDPVSFMARWLYSHRPVPASTGLRDCTSSSTQIKTVCISDTHNTQPVIPDGDILLHGGDLTDNGTFAELQSQIDWIASLPHRHKVVIAGNHDRLLDAKFVAEHPERNLEAPGLSRVDLNWHDITYLQNSSVTLSLLSTEDDSGHKSSASQSKASSADQRDITAKRATLKIYGSPLTPSCGAFAFQYPPIRDVWKKTVPTDADIVLVHGPPKGYLDSPDIWHEGKGCPHLARELQRVRPKLAVFGHIHSGHGLEYVDWNSSFERSYSRLVCMTEDPLQRNKPLVRWTAILSLAFGFLFAWIDALVVSPIFRFLRHRRKHEATSMVNAAVGSDGATTAREAVVILI